LRSQPKSLLENLGTSVLRHNPIADSPGHEFPGVKLLPDEDAVGLLELTAKRAELLE
jgi:hypothetical protein